MKSRHFISSYLNREDAVAALEAALLFPLLMSMVVILIDGGNAVRANQKLIAAAQMTADLITRQSNPTLQQRADAIVAAREAMAPFEGDEISYEVLSLEFDEQGNPQTLWRDASSAAFEDTDLPSTADGLGEPGEGVLVVRMAYTYRPFFTGFVAGNFQMEEVAYMRGRQSPVVGLPPDES